MCGVVLERIQPGGVFSVGVLTVLGSLGLLLFALWFFVLGISVQGSALPMERLSLVFVIEVTGLFGGWGILLLMDAVLIFRGMRIGYFLSMVSWILTLAADVLLSYHLGLFDGTSIAPLGALPFLFYALYPIVGFVYFLRSNVKTYFRINDVRTYLFSY